MIDELISTELDSEQNLSLLYPKTEQLQNIVKSTPNVALPQNHKNRKCMNLILLDMTWGHSKRLLANSSALKQIPRLTLETQEIESSQSKIALSSRDSILKNPDLDKFSYNMIRNGKRKSNEVNSFESVVYALVNYGLMSSEQVNPVWTQYQYWLKQMSSVRRTT